MCLFFVLWTGLPHRLQLLREDRVYDGAADIVEHAQPGMINVPEPFLKRGFKLGWHFLASYSRPAFK
jgi:hypothetical protein